MSEETLPPSPGPVSSGPLDSNKNPKPKPSPNSYEIALIELNKLPNAEVTFQGYLRESFGPGWGDPDRNGCDARNDILKRDLTDETFRAGTNGCVVTSGNLQDPYTGQEVRFLKGNDTSILVQIDHVVPLFWAWKYGAATWTYEERYNFHNDPDNLLAVDGAANEEKSASGPSEWLPRNGYLCQYSLKWVQVLTKYGLPVPSDDRNVLEAILSKCG
ncbi:MAG: HNH endonuclease [Microbacteriaceae bacterium]|nr:HNH endonuclease [Microbacteriaceae bacterium]